MAERMSDVVLSRVAYELGTDILPPVKDLRALVEEVLRARVEVLRLLAEREAWQDATGLVGASGDPSSVTPENLRTHIGALVSVLQRLLEGAGDADENGWVWVQVQLPEEVVSEARALLREAP